MPTNVRNQLIWNFTGNPETVNETTAYAPGCLGAKITVGGKTYQYVQLDSGAVAAAAIATAAGQITVWKDKETYLVTNDIRFSEAGRNAPAGTLATAITAGSYGFVQKGGVDASAKTAGSPAIGDLAVVNSGTAADLTPISAGTAPTYIVVGRYRSVATSSLADVDLLLSAYDD